MNPDSFKVELANAIMRRDARAVGKLVEAGRFRGMNYRALFDLAHSATGIELADWDALLQEADASEAES